MKKGNEANGVQTMNSRGLTHFLLFCSFALAIATLPPAKAGETLFKIVKTDNPAVPNELVFGV